MLLKKNTKVGKIKLSTFLPIFLILLLISFDLNSENNLDGRNTNIKVLDKISSKNTLIELKNGKDFQYKDLLIKSFKCKNSEFDDDPEVIAYIQVKDLTNTNKDDVFIFNGWMFSSSPSIAPFDHPVYDIWLVSCF